MHAQGSTEFLLWNRGAWPRVDVVGEKFHEHDIRRLFPGGFANGSQTYEGVAHLLPEPNNPHDPNAVAVRVEGGLVGYLAKELAARYVQTLTTLTTNGLIPSTACQIWAYEYQDWQGSDRRGRDVYRQVLDARASIVLDEPHLCVPANMPPSRAHKMLPHGAALQVKGEEAHLDVLAPLIRDHGEAWTYATLHTLSIGSGKSEKRIVELRLDGEPIGQLTPAMSAHYLSVIDHHDQSGMLTAAKVLLKGNTLQVEAVLHAARAHELDSAWLAPTMSATRDQSQAGAPPAPAIERAAPPTPDHGAADRTPQTVASAGTIIPAKPERIVFRAPPGWPPPPEGWEPFPGWQPAPEWPAPPEAWQFWVPA